MRLDLEDAAAGVGNSPVVETPNLWVTKWVDYTSKYGLGYLSCNGSVGIYFNDSSKIILSSQVRARLKLASVLF